MNALYLIATVLNEEPPDTVSYLILGYVIIGVVGLGYVATLLIRQRNLRRELDVLERLEKDED
jgi:CcmD family protein